MDEFNPYAPPRCGAPAPLPPAAPRGFRAYCLVNWLYAAAMLLALLILLRSGTLRAELHHLLVVAICLAPLVSFALVLGRCTAPFLRWFWVQGLGSAGLVLLCLLDLSEGRGLRGIGVFMTLANVLALFAGAHFLERRAAPRAEAGRRA